MAIDFSLSSFFALVNFAALCGLVSYLFTKFLKDPLKRLIAQQAEQRSALYKEIEHAQSKRDNLETTRKQQLITIAALMQKLHDWRAAILLKNNCARDEQHAINKALEAKLKKQSENYSSSYLKHKVAPQSLAESRVALQTMLGNKQAQQTYMDTLFSFIKASEQS